MRIEAEEFSCRKSRKKIATQRLVMPITHVRFLFIFICGRERNFFRIFKSTFASGGGSRELRGKAEAARGDFTRRQDIKTQTSSSLAFIIANCLGKQREDFSLHAPRSATAKQINYANANAFGPRAIYATLNHRTDELRALNSSSKGASKSTFAGDIIPSTYVGRLSASKLPHMKCN